MDVATLCANQDQASCLWVALRQRLFCVKVSCTACDEPMPPADGLALFYSRLHVLLQVCCSAVVYGHLKHQSEVMSRCPNEACMSMSRQWVHAPGAASRLHMKKKELG